MKIRFMKPGLLSLGFIALLLVAQFATVKAQLENNLRPERQPASNQAISAAEQSPLMFIENVGQFDDGARFQMRGGNHTLWLADEAIWLTILEPASPSPAEELDFSMQPDTIQREDDTLHGVHIRLSFPGANPQPAIEPFHPLTTTLSYFRGADPAGWQPNVPVWGGVRYADLYPGIDLEMTSDGHLSLPGTHLRL